jgi:hypothetical protein
MPDNEPTTDEERRQAALRAGWDGHGPVPEGHGLAPEIDPALGHNGIADTGAERIA